MLKPTYQIEKNMFKILIFIRQISSKVIYVRHSRHDRAHRTIPKTTCQIMLCMNIEHNPLTLSYGGGGGGRNTPPLFCFLHHPKTAEGIKLKLSDFKDTPLRHILQVKPVRYILRCCHGNKITNVP